MLGKSQFERRKHFRWYLLTILGLQNIKGNKIKPLRLNLILSNLILIKGIKSDWAVSPLIMEDQSLQFCSWTVNDKKLTFICESGHQIDTLKKSLLKKYLVQEGNFKVYLFLSFFFFF